MTYDRKIAEEAPSTDAVELRLDVSLELLLQYLSQNDQNADARDLLDALNPDCRKTSS